MTAINQATAQRTHAEAARLHRRRRLFTALHRVVTYLLLLLTLLIVVVPLLWAVAASLTPNEMVFRYVFPFSWRALLPSDPTLTAYITRTCAATG